MRFVVCAFAGLILSFCSLCGGGSVSTPKRYQLKYGREYTSTCFQHFKGLFHSDAYSSVNIIACETESSYENSSLTAKLNFKIDRRVDGRNTSELHRNSTERITQSTDVNTGAVAEQQPKQHNLAAVGRKGTRAENRAGKQSKSQTNTEKSKNAVKKASSIVRKNSKLQSDELETQTGANRTDHESHLPKIFDQLVRETRELHGRKCKPLRKSETASILNCKKLLIREQCRTSRAGVYSVVLKGYGNFKILVTQHLAGLN